MSTRNEVCIAARLTGRSQLRFTPAGVAVAEAEFEHRSVVVEAGGERHLAFTLQAIVLGGAAQRLQGEPLGAEVELAGFLAPRSRRSQRLVLHVVGLRRIGESVVAVQPAGQDAGRPTTSQETAGQEKVDASHP